MGKLENDGHERYCQEYVIDLNQTQAYIRAGYAAKGAKDNASRLTANDSIQARITELQKYISERLQISAADVARELMRLGFSNVADFLEDNDKLKEIVKLPRHITAAVASIKTGETSNGIGAPPTIETEIKFHSKERALESLAKHVGFFKEDNTQKHVPVQDLSMLSEKELEIMGAIQEKINKANAQ